jgi:hypothetical protein
VAAFVVNSEPHTGAGLSVRVCVGLATGLFLLGPKLAPSKIGPKRAPVWGFEFTTKAIPKGGGVQQIMLLGLNFE